MANQLPYQQDMHDYSIPNGEIDILTFSFGYLRTCVRLAQSCGIYDPEPSSSSIGTDTIYDIPGALQEYLGTDTGYDIPGALQEAQYQDTNLEVYHHEQNPGPSNNNYPRLETSNQSMDTNYSQHDHSFNVNPYMETRTTDPAYNNHHNSFPISDNHDMIIDPRPSQEHGNDQHQNPSLSATDATIPDRVSHFSSLAFVDHLSLAVVYNYDPLWVEKPGAELRSVFGFISRMKFEELFRSGVMQEGDRLVVAYTYVSSELVGREVATLTVCGLIPPYPDLTLTLSSQPSYTRTLSACKSIGAILDALSDCKVRGPGINNYLAENLVLWRGDQNLGSLHFVRQVYHAWKNRVLDVESVRTGTA